MRCAAFIEIFSASFLTIILFILTLEPTGRVSAQRISSLKKPSAYYTTVEFVCSDGYPIQEHTVVTPDGYILMVHRIPNGNRRPKVKRGSHHYTYVHKGYHPDFKNCVAESRNATGGGMPVVVTHGLLMTSDGWVLQGPGYDLVYLLADAGYDVWMVNVRGNFYSRAHQTLSPSDPKFWDFSFHEHAMYDVPSVIDYTLQHTNYKKVLYVGYSMGTSILFSMSAMRPEYANKILGAVALAPVVYLSRANAPNHSVRIYETIVKLVEELQRKNVKELFPRTEESINVGVRYCSKYSGFQDLCYDLFTTFTGYHTKIILREQLALLLTHIPAGSSVKNVLHFINNYKNGDFAMFDYGVRENMKLYGRAFPPEYPVWNATVPVALYYSQGDRYFLPKEQRLLEEVLPNVIDVKALKNFNHVDYIWSYRARELVYSRALYVMNYLRKNYLSGSRKKTKPKI